MVGGGGDGGGGVLGGDGTGELDSVLLLPAVSLVSTDLMEATLP